MKNILIIALAFLSLLSKSVYSQDSNLKVRAKSPYTTSFKVDAPIIAGGVGLTILGTVFIQNKDSLTQAELQTKTVDKIPFFDRSNAGYYSEQANDDSYLPFFASFGMPVVMVLINKNERQKAGQVLVLYGETMAITGTLFTLSAGLIDRSRPMVYSSTNDWHDSEAPYGKRTSKNSQRSFFAGHTAATAAASFFAAKVFADFNPDSKAKPYIWALAAALPASVGYMRYKSGNHFLSDNLLGYAIGAGTGILVPQLHKNKFMQDVTILPGSGDRMDGVTMLYRF